jgi:hypothetical protein
MSHAMFRQFYQEKILKIVSLKCKLQILIYHFQRLHTGQRNPTLAGCQLSQLSPFKIARDQLIFLPANGTTGKRAQPTLEVSLA